MTCNYEARRRGLRKLQLITEAKSLVPDIVIVLGEDLTRFRNASKDLFRFLASFSWNGKVEGLGFDEVFMDVSDMIDWNIDLLNHNDLQHSFFQMNRKDPTLGWPFDATEIAGHTYPKHSGLLDLSDRLTLQLLLGSHLAQHLRWRLDDEMGYTCTVGISTNKTLSKLVGNLNKPQGQTTLLPPYTDIIGNAGPQQSNVTTFMDSHDIGNVPGCGFKASHLIRNYVLSRTAEFDYGLIYGRTLEAVTVNDVRSFHGMGPALLQKILGGPGSERAIGSKIWALINGLDETEVKQKRKVPTQISIEDSYIRLDTMSQVTQELTMLATSLLRRMHADLLEHCTDDSATGESTDKWIAYPRTIRLSTRPRLPLNSNGTRERSFQRISTSGPLPRFVFKLDLPPETIVDQWLQTTLLPMFRRLHPQPSGWNLSLVNLCVTGMVETASEEGGGGGRDIGQMMRRQEEVLREWKVEDRDIPPESLHVEHFQNSPSATAGTSAGDVNHRLGSDPAWQRQTQLVGSEDFVAPTQTQSTNEEAAGWEEDFDDEVRHWSRCTICNASMPAFAMAAHERFHDLAD